MISLKFDKIMDFDIRRNRDIYEEIVVRFKDDSLIPFIGAGLSAFLFKTWDMFINAEYQAYIPDQKISKDPLVSVQKLFKKLGRTEFFVDIGMYCRFYDSIICQFRPFS